MLLQAPLHVKCVWIKEDGLLTFSLVFRAFSDGSNFQGFSLSDIPLTIKSLYRYMGQNNPFFFPSFLFYFFFIFIKFKVLVDFAMRFHWIEMVMNGVVVY